MGEARISVDVPSRRMPSVFVCFLTPVRDEREFRVVDGYLTSALSLWEFRADWIERTGRSPVTDWRDPVRRRIPWPLSQAHLACARPEQRVANARDVLRLLRCCRAVLWLWWDGDPAPWNVACRLLADGWAGTASELKLVVESLTTNA
jgi:hypothetical protein